MIGGKKNAAVGKNAVSGFVNKEDPGNYKPISLSSVTGKVMEQIISSEITWHVLDNQVVRSASMGSHKSGPA